MCGMGVLYFMSIKSFLLYHHFVVCYQGLGLLLYAFIKTILVYHSRNGLHNHLTNVINGPFSSHSHCSTKTYTTEFGIHHRLESCVGLQNVYGQFCWNNLNKH